MYNTCKVCGSNLTLKIKKLNLVECDNCKLIFSDKKFSQEEFIKTYDLLYNKIENSHYNIHTNL